MKPIKVVTVFGLIAALGLLWALGCSSNSPTGSGGTALWTIELYGTPNIVISDTGTALISCHLIYSGDSLVYAKQIHFNTYGENQLPASVVTLLGTTDTSATGTTPVIYYHSNLYSGNVDTIYAHYEEQGVILAQSKLAIPISHPILTLLLTPDSLQADSAAEITCFLRYGSTITAGHQISFFSKAQMLGLSPAPGIDPPIALSSETSATGLATPVFYHPNGCVDSLDTIYALLYSYSGIDTAAIDSVTVHLIH
jgi:hypothetical protein